MYLTEYLMGENFFNLGTRGPSSDPEVDSPFLKLTEKASR